MEIVEPFLELIKLQKKETLPQTQAAFEALVDAIIPRTDGGSGEKGPKASLGALDLHTAEYPIWSLNHLFSLYVTKIGINIPLANATAEMLNIAAQQLLSARNTTTSFNRESGEAAFAALEPIDRLRTMALLEDQKIDPRILPMPFRNDPGLVVAVTGVLALLTVTGFYSEWSGYGGTSLNKPEKRKIEHFPASWEMVGYPGPAKGYHVLRGNPVNKFTE